jgi:hypothetical protein
MLESPLWPDSWFHTFAIGLSRFLGTERPADALESLVTFGGVAYEWPADRAIDRALAQKKSCGLSRPSKPTVDIPANRAMLAFLHSPIGDEM